MNQHRDQDDKPKDPTANLSWEEDSEWEAQPAKPSKPTAQERKLGRPKAKAKLSDEARAFREYIERAAKQYSDAHPGKSEEYTFRVSPLVLPKSQGATRDSYRAIIQRILTPEGATSTQMEIRRTVVEVYKAGDVKDWTKPLPAWVLKDLSAMLAASEAPFNQIAAKPGLTLSKLHREAKQLYEAHRDGGINIKAHIVMTADTVYINGKAWKISPTQKRITVTVAQLAGLAK